MSIFSGKCWRCFPAFCKCPSDEGEIEQIKSERFLAERAYLSERSRRIQAEMVITKILNSHSEGCLLLSGVVSDAQEYANKFARSEPPEVQS